MSISNLIFSNVLKLKQVVFGKNNIVYVPSICYNSTSLPVSLEIKFLGVTFSHNLSWKIYTDVQFLNPIEYLISLLCGIYWEADRRILLMLYKSLQCNLPPVAIRLSYLIERLVLNLYSNCNNSLLSELLNPATDYIRNPYSHKCVCGSSYIYCVLQIPILVFGARYSYRSSRRLIYENNNFLDPQIRQI